MACGTLTFLRAGYSMMFYLSLLLLEHRDRKVVCPSSGQQFWGAPKQPHIVPGEKTLVPVTYAMPQPWPHRQPS